MAFKGTRTRTATEIAIEFDMIGGHFNAYTSRENTVYYTKVLSRHTKEAMTILADILQDSLFNSDEIAKEFNVEFKLLGLVRIPLTINRGVPP